MRLVTLVLLACIVFPAQSEAQAPVFAIMPEESTVKFFVKASVALEGTFLKWDATRHLRLLNFRPALLDIKVQADGVDTGSGMKDGKLKSKDFFDLKQTPVIRFVSKKIVQTGPTTFEV